ncbi:MAG: hypothetical protein KF749_09470 [Bacteroidetes bacterium]|nr:hypothetical protein [Bacteroidota bacterium]MCW5894854.1 hypothetical protein [Bacteroidota bacterium]
MQNIRTRVYRGGAVSFGLWINRFFLADIRVHYIVQGQEQRVYENQGTATDLSAEGLGFTLKGAVTFALTKGMIVDLGGGYLWDNYEVAIVQRSTLTNAATGRVANRTKVGSAILSGGLRLGSQNFWLNASSDFLFDGRTFRGYHLIAGVNFLL